MRITDSQVAMQSRQELSKTYTRTESLRAWARDEQSRQQQPHGDRLELSDEAKRLLETAAPASATGSAGGDPAAQLDPEDRLRILILQALLGVDVKVAAGLPASVRDAQETADKVAADAKALHESEGSRRQGWGATYTADETYRESETLNVSAQGVIHTADGQTIAFSVDLGMSREFVQSSHVRIRAGDDRLVDPLVINYGGPAAELTQTKFRFDLEVGGEAEEISFLQPGSGFLALDRNGNGAIDNGSELFGPGSGDGFAELAQYDADGNHWIDAGDPIFDKLRIYSKDAAGNDALLALGQAGVGAIYIGGIAAGFTMTDSSNNTLGMNRQAGVFLREDGTAGTVQQLDLKA